MVVLGERHLRRVLSEYFRYYHKWRPHYSLEMDSPDGREVHGRERGRVVELPEVGGLHYRYERRAA